MNDFRNNNKNQHLKTSEVHDRIKRVCHTSNENETSMDDSNRSALGGKWAKLCDSDSDIVSTDSDSENFESDFSDFDVIETGGNNFDFLNKFRNPIYGNAEVTQ